MMTTPNRISQYFQFEGTVDSVQPYGNGHINDTYLVSMNASKDHAPRYILQRINDHVFKDPQGLMENIEMVIGVLKEKVTAGGGDTGRETLTMIPAIDGRSLYLSEEGEYWRAYAFIENTISYDRVEDYDQVRQAALAFGGFQNMVSECVPAAFNTTIPDFHNTEQRFANLVRALEGDVINRAGTASTEIEFALNREEKTSVLLELFRQGLLPERISTTIPN
jgi:hypothetical protein